MSRTILTAVIGLLITASPALAGYITNKAGWNRLDDKHSYVMGIFDGLAVSTNPSTDELAYVRGLNRCGRENGITALELVQMVDQGYAEDVANWSQPPLTMMLRGLNRLCNRQLNEERLAVGLGPMPVPHP